MEGIQQMLSEHGYNIQSEIGWGTFSHCYLCVSQKYKITFVAKVIDIANSLHKKSFEVSFYQELTTLTKLIHPNVINIYDSFSDNNYFVLILEYCPNGNLEEYIKKNSPIKESEILNFARQILEVLSYCHQNNICHHDIKPCNIFIDNFNRVKLADFGIAQIIQQHEKSIVYGGSIPYMPPEVFRKLPYNSFKADVWAFGVTLFQLVSGGKLPFFGLNIVEIYDSICKCKYELPPICNPTIEQLIRHSLDLDVDHRWSSQQLCDYINSSLNHSIINPLKYRVRAKLNNKRQSSSKVFYENLHLNSPIVVIPVIRRNKSNEEFQ
ncbi:CAMK family protein kinase [Trichomonas vaginalis G3]|uniref:CAMK family protein kinase n=1 Tax=Trichomonas vaginalis (strain ATCC PRA-98 / G3) TaxID=412133 RepID=A2EZI0_TRIV3|nr:protein serine/threonine kinase protein [Trichomonas vaginalis G3]EAY01946.1 CAMK family protein kinase [Trichomonas vaginalis G3]KAI5506274.1 protein serine/threonine kinase protein [Trichomonas vaginalis G3]|eukprot:XP_001330461.1 CAMK family protein kinase [Trichomonas vaginalis G3]